MEHEQRVRHEFARQAERFGAAPAIADGTQTRRIVDAVAPGATAVILDLACGPGLVTAALAPRAHTVIAFDLTPEMLDAARFSVVSESQWDRTRELEEWFGIVDDAERVAPLRTVVHALAAAGVDAGMGLARADGAVTFIHHWRLIVARKPSA